MDKEDIMERLKDLHIVGINSYIYKDTGKQCVCAAFDADKLEAENIYYGDIINTVVRVLGAKVFNVCRCDFEIYNDDADTKLVKEDILGPFVVLIDLENDYQAD